MKNSDCTFSIDELIERVTDWENGWIEHECMYEDEDDLRRNRDALLIIKNLIKTVLTLDPNNEIKIVKRSEYEHLL